MISKIMAISTLLYGAFAMAAANAASMNPRTFHYPKVGNERLDWCLVWAKNCGQDAADDFCRMKGYHMVSKFQIDRNIGRTRLIGERTICQNPSCDGFKYIECSYPVDLHDNQSCKKTFHEPEYQGHPLDRCLIAFGGHCGGDAARSYCRMRGYKEASNWDILWDRSATTRAIGDGRMCTGYGWCDAFKSIECKDPLPRCPKIEPGTRGICVQRCSSNSCADDELCCSNGCGNFCTKGVSSC